MAEKNEKILVDITGLSRYHDNLKVVLETKANEAAAATAQALTDAKAYADSLVMVDGVAKFDAAGAAATAEQNAKDYADGLAINYDAAGAAADALDAAKTYADGAAADAKAAAEATASADATSKANAAKDAAIAAAATDATTKANAAQSAAEATAATDATAKANAAKDAAIEAAATDATEKATAAETAAKAHADGLNTAMDVRVAKLEAIDHEKLASDASAAAVATVLDGAPEKFDTLKEVAQWIADSESAATAADLVTRVGALEAIDHDAYKAADAALETSLKLYTDQAEADAIAAAKEYVDETFELLVLATDADIDKLFGIQ